MHLRIKLLTAFLFIIVTFQAFSQSVDDRKLIKHIAYLSADELKGRKTGTEENEIARKYIVEEFKNMGLNTFYPEFTEEFRFQSRREGKTLIGKNVIGFVPGTESKKIIVVTAHFDHVGIGKANAEGDSIFNGADDNASGTAALLEMAKYFSQNPSKHSILFAALDGEEMGLQGAKALVSDFPFELDQIALNINMDMISRNEKGELYVSGTYHHPELRAILEEASKGKKPHLKFGHDLPGTGSDDWTKSSDHGAFFEKGIPHIYFGVEDHEDYHKQSDEFKNIDPEFLIDATNLILSCILRIDEVLLKE
ncbi:M28 family peptidase [Algoriphagus sp. PAP.12]|uniref:M28 family peptidase n=1 Tax=Algoriphagus sp. PAP.12 TaxID=2996678 RepID=UPI00227C6CD3|nr:M28 family peptidase [Algoriphagus sp. PAP.12]